MATDNSATINPIYDAINNLPTGTAPNSADLALYNSQLNATPPATVASIQAEIENSAYTQNFVNPVIREYQAAFGRVPDQAGLQFWTGIVAANPSALANLNTIFANSNEFLARYGATATTPSSVALVTALYTNVLGRPPEPAGLAYWASQPLNASQLLQAFAQSAEFISDTSSYITNYQNLEVAGTEPTSGSLFSVPSPTTTAITTSTFTLTPNQDFITGTGAGKDTISAPTIFNAGSGSYINTLSVGDKIVETGTGNSLTATFAAGGSSLPQPSGLNISGVQTFNLTDLVGSTTTTLSGSIAGLTTVNDNSSTTPSGVSTLALGAAGLGLTTALTNVTISGATTNHSFSATVLASALSGTTDSIAVSINGNFGAKSLLGGSSTLTIAPDSGTNGYETFALTVAGPGDYIDLSQGTGTSLNTITLAGSGNVELDAATGFASNFKNVTTIDASTGNDTGNITITGFLDKGGISGAGIGQGSGVGLLSSDTSLTSVKLGGGNDIIDLSNLTLAQEAKITTLDGGTGADTVVFSNALLNSISTTALTETNFETIGINYTGGATTIDASKLGTGITTLKDFNSETGASVTLNNVATGFTFDAEQFGNSAALSVTQGGTGTSDVFNLIEGSTAGTGTHGNLGSVSITGFETVNIIAQGGSGDATADVFGSIIETVTGTAAAVININGTQNVTSGTIEELIGTGASAPTSSTLAIADTGAVTFLGTNIATISGASSGGVIENGNYFGNTAGATITGSATGHNQLVGFTSNDTFTGGAAGDNFVTGGGADTITLGTTPVSDNIFLGSFLVQSGAIAATAQALDAGANPTTNNIQGILNGFGGTAITDSQDTSQAGYFGNVAGGTPAPIEGTAGIFATGGAIASYGGISTDMSVVKNFLAGTSGDTLAVSSNNWGSGFPNADLGLNLGLTNGDFTHLVGGTASLNDASIQNVASNPAGTAITTTTNLIVLTSGTYDSVANVVQALHTSYKLNFTNDSGAEPNGFDAHLLVAYTDKANATRIADVDFETTANVANGAVVSSNNLHEYGSDLVQLQGVSASNLVASNLHFLA